MLIIGTFLGKQNSDCLKELSMNGVQQIVRVVEVVEVVERTDKGNSMIGNKRENGKKS